MIFEKKNSSLRNYSNLNKNLGEIMHLKSMTIQNLSDKAKLAVGTIQKLLTDPNCNPTISSIESICNVLNISISELIGQKKDLIESNSSKVPLIEWENVISFQKSIKLVNLVHTYISVPSQQSKESFALRVKDDSMGPLFPKNAILIFDINISPKNNSYVLSQLNNFQDIIFKQLLIDEPFKYLSSTNPKLNKDIIKMKPMDKIIAVLIQSQLFYENEIL